MDLSYLKALGYSEEKIANYSRSWSNGIVKYLAEKSDRVVDNMKYLQADFEEIL